MISIEQAVLNRWNALNLDATIPGSIQRSQVPEPTITDPTQFQAYCQYEVLSDKMTAQSRASRYNERDVQFKIWYTNDDVLETLCQTVRNAFMNSNLAATSPLAGSSNYDGIIKQVRCTQNPVIIQETDKLWSGTFVFAITYAEDSGLTPG